MPNQVGESVDINVKGECQFGGNGHDNGPYDPLPYTSVEFFSILKQEDDGTQENQRDDILADLLKWGQSHPFDEANREDIPIEDRQEQKESGKGVSEKDKINFQFSS